MLQQCDSLESMASCIIGTVGSGETQRRVMDAIDVTRNLNARLWNRFLDTWNGRCRQEKSRPFAVTETDTNVSLTAHHIVATTH